MRDEVLGILVQSSVVPKSVSVNYQHRGHEKMNIFTVEIPIPYIIEVYFINLYLFT